MALQGVQPMFIRSKHNDGYLVVTLPYDRERNGVYAYSDLPGSGDISVSVGLNIGIGGIGIGLPIGSDISMEDAKWNLAPMGNGSHEIINIKSNEPLYAGADHIAYDNDRRRVFTWRTRDHDNGSWRHWTLHQCGNGFYTIRNNQYGEYLYAADFPKTGYVFTWREVGQSSFNDKFYWQLINA